MTDAASAVLGACPTWNLSRAEDGMAETADVAVIGLGAVGSATLYRLARAGAKVVGIDRYHPPHTMGSSHGESRITRLAVGEGADYAPLVRRSHAIWRELESETGETLMVQTGGLIMGPSSGAANHHGKDDFVRRTIRVAQQSGVAVEMLDATAIAARFPQFLLQGDEIGCYEPTAGLVFPERCVDVQLRLAARHGATTYLGERVLDMRTVSGGNMEIVTDRRTIHAARVVLSAGPWLPALASSLAPVARVFRQTLHWFAADEADFASSRFPVFIWMHGEHEEDYFYGFPAQPGSGSVKVASERYAGPADPDTVDRNVDATESAQIFARHVSGRLRAVTPIVVRSATCLYTVTPDAGFILDLLPEHPSVIAASACSGHGFKHSAAVGEQLAAQAMGSIAGQPTSFALTRLTRA